MIYTLHIVDVEIAYWNAINTEVVLDHVGDIQDRQEDIYTCCCAVGKL
jgi:hypothetical protein